MEVITSRQNPRVIRVNEIYKNQTSDECKLFVNESLVNFKETLKLNLIEEIYVTEEGLKDFPFNEIDKEKVFIVKENVMEKMSQLKHHSSILFISKKPTFSDENIHKVIYLDDVQDPGNVGTIIRTALAFGFDEVVLSEKSASLYNPKVLSATRTALYKIKVIKQNFIAYAKNHENHQVIATSLSNDSIFLDDFKDLKKDFILVLGNEGHGVSQEILNLSDVTLKIKMDGIESLNVSSSAAIFAYILGQN